MMPILKSKIRSTIGAIEFYIISEVCCSCQLCTRKPAFIHYIIKILRCPAWE